MAHENCSLAIDQYGNFYIAGAKPGWEEDGDWDGETYYKASYSELDRLNQRVADMATAAFGHDIVFTVASCSLIALDSKSQRQLGYWDNDKGWVPD